MANRWVWSRISPPDVTRDLQEILNSLAVNLDLSIADLIAYAARPAEPCTMISRCGFTIQKSRKLFREIVQHALNAKILVLENKELYGIDVNQVPP